MLFNWIFQELDTTLKYWPSKITTAAIKGKAPLENK